MLNTQLFQTIDNDYIDSETYEIDKSLRFRGSASAYLSKNYTTTPVDTNARIKTYSFWVKRGQLATNQIMISTAYDVNNYWAIMFDSNDKLWIGCNNVAEHGGVVLLKISTQVFRDVGAWYHIHINVDTTNIIAEDRVKAYVNGNRITNWVTNTVPALNNHAASFLSVRSGTWIARIGSGYLNPYLLDGYLAEINVIDGQALDPTYFGRIDNESGQWVPKKYGGNYGTNGFYLDFKDSTSLTTLCADKSGNGNNWTPTNISLTAGVNYDSMLDTPTNNFATLNDIDYVYPGSVNGVQNGGLTVNDNYSWVGKRSTFSATSSFGKIYYEMTVASTGSASANFPNVGLYENGKGSYYPGYDGNSFGYWQGGTISYNGATITTVSSFTNNDVIGIAYDPSTGKIWVSKNGVWQGSGSPDPASGTSPIYTLPINDNRSPGFYTGAGYAKPHANFGQRPFAHTPPAGFQSLCSKNLPVPSITRGETGMDIATYTGNGGNIQVGEYQFPRPNYLINRSLRFKGANSHLSRTFGTPSNSSIATLSLWFKLSAYSTPMWLFEYANDGNFRTNIHIKGDNRIYIEYLSSGTLIWQCYTIQAISPSDWKHLVISKNLSATVASDRYKIYLNGVLQSTAGSYPGLNQADYFNSALACRLGIYVGGIYSFNGYMAEVNFVDGQALTPTQFGEQDVNGYWIPKAYTGTYGTNGFYLPFSDNNALTTTSNVGLGKDFSGNGNYWTTNNISLTAGTTYDSMIDSPTNNFATLDVLTGNVVGGTLYDGNLSQSFSRPSGTGYQSIHNLNIIPDDNLNIYFEIVINSVSFDGNSGVYLLIENKLGQWLRFMRNGYGQNEYDYSNSTPISIPAALVNGNIFSISINMETKKLTFALNGTTMGVLDGWSTNLKKIGIFGGGNGGASMSTSVNFGQRPFVYTPPTGFKTVSIPNIAEYTSDLESPDLVWIKSRSAATNHMLFDSVRGAGKYISSNLTAIDTTDVNSLVSFNKNGFYLGNNAAVNTLNNTYVSWMWKKGIAKGLDIVPITSTGSTTPLTINHSLGVVPSFIIIKNLNLADNWWVYHSSYANKARNYTQLNTTGVVSTAATDLWGVGGPTSTAINCGNQGVFASAAGQNCLFYLFAEIEGYSKFGSYTGNGSADGPFVYCGFKPRWIMVKRTDSTGNWQIWDTFRGSYNTINTRLAADVIDAEGTNLAAFDLISNGFKLRDTNANWNTTNGNYIYAAFAETPFKYATAR